MHSQVQEIVFALVNNSDIVLNLYCNCNHITIIMMFDMLQNMIHKHMCTKYTIGKQILIDVKDI